MYLIQYKERGLDRFKTAISLPGISLNWAFNTVPKEQKFYLFPLIHAGMGEAMRSNLTGGPSIIFHCCQVKGVTPIHGNDNKTLFAQSLFTMLIHCISDVQLSRWVDGVCLSA